MARAHAVFENGIAVCVGDERIRSRVGHLAVVREGGVCLRHFAHRYAVGKLAESERSIVTVRLDELEAHALGEIFKRNARRELIDDLRGDGIF